MLISKKRLVVALTKGLIANGNPVNWATTLDQLVYKPTKHFLVSFYAAA
jgi:hypothetical protein